MRLRERLGLTFLLTLIGSILIVANGVLVLLNGAPIVVSSYPANKVEEVLGVDRFWARITFGRPGLVEGNWAYFWLFFYVIMFICSLMIFARPKKQNMWSIPIVIFSLLSVVTGGGFVIGFVLAFIGGMAGVEWPKRFGETFFGKFLRVFRLDSKLFVMVRDNPSTLNTAVWMLIIAGFLSGLGGCVYAYNVDTILRGELGREYDILIKGNVFFNNLHIVLASTHIAVIFIKWLIMSLLIYLVAVRICGLSLDLGAISRMVAFAYIPLTLRLFLPVMFANEPFLTFNWPFIMQTITALWIFAALVVGLKAMSEISVVKSLGIIVFSGTLYLLVTERILYSMFEVPGVLLTFTPGSSAVLLILMSFSTVIAVLLGAFSRT